MRPIPRLLKPDSFARRRNLVSKFTMTAETQADRRSGQNQELHQNELYEPNAKTFVHPPSLRVCYLNRFSLANRPYCAAIFRALLWRQGPRPRFRALALSGSGDAYGVFFAARERHPWQERRFPKIFREL